MEPPAQSRAATLVADESLPNRAAVVSPIPAPTPAWPAPAGRRPYLPLRPRRVLTRADAAIAAALFLGSLGLYTATLTRGLSAISGDSNELISKSALFQVAHSPGSPLYEWLGKLFTFLPVGEVAGRVTGMSVLLGAVAVAVLYLIGARFVTGARLGAAGAAAIFALSLTFWSQAVIAELYTPNLGLLGPAVWCLLEWAACRSAAADARVLANPYHARTWLLAAVGLFAAANGVHLSDLMFIPVFALFMLLGWPVVPRGGAGAGAARLWARVRALDWRLALAAGGVGALALLPYGWLALAQPNNPSWDMWPRTAPNWQTFYDFTLNAFANLRFRLPYTSWPDRTWLILHLLQRNFGWLPLPFLLAGAGRLLARHTRLFYLFAGMALANLVFYATYTVPDLDVFFIPCYWALMPMLALGLDWAAGGAAAGLARLRGVGAGTGRAAGAAASVGLGALLLTVCAGQGADNYTVNDQAADTAFRDFYGNVFAGLPRGAWYFTHGASLGYDLVYYTQVYHVRPDLHVVIGPQPGETAPPPWPAGPVYSGILKHDVFAPAFTWDPTGQNNKWYTPALIGMFRWTGMANSGWLRLFRVSPNDAPPPEWVVPAGSAVRPQIRFDVLLTPDLTLTGVDLPARAVAGRPLHLVRYWRAATPTLPALATVLGEHRAVEVHTPLMAQLPDYLAARHLDPALLARYIIREDVPLVIPSNTPPGRYRITVSPAARRLEGVQIDPAPAAELLPRELTLGWVQVGTGPPGPPPDPLSLTGPGPTEELP